MPEPRAIGYVARMPDTINQGLVENSRAEYLYRRWLNHVSRLRKAAMTEFPTRIAEISPGPDMGLGLCALLSGCESYVALDIVPHDPVASEHLLTELYELFKARRPHDRELWVDAPRVGRALAPDRIERIRCALGGKPQSDVRVEFLVPWMNNWDRYVGAIDLIVSQSVMAQVAELPTAYAVMAHLLKPDGWMSHDIDLQSGSNQEATRHLRLIEQFGLRIAKTKRPESRLFDEGGSPALFIQADKHISTKEEDEARKIVHALRGTLVELSDASRAVIAAYEGNSSSEIKTALKRTRKLLRRAPVWRALSVEEMLPILRVPGRPQVRLAREGSALVAEDRSAAYPLRRAFPHLRPQDAMTPPSSPGSQEALVPHAIPAGLFLDIGTKTGNGFVRFVTRYMEELGIERSSLRGVIGVDLMHSRVARAEMNGVSPIAADATILPFADDAFEVTVIMELLEHIPAEIAVNVLKEAARVTRRLIFIQHPDFSSESRLRELGLKFTWMDWRVHVHHITKERMESMLEEAGLAGRVEQLFPVESSDHEELLPLSTAHEAKAYDSLVHGPKPKVKFDEQPVFLKQRVVIDLAAES